MQTNIPLLAKGQIGVQDLISGMKPTYEQWGIAIQRALERIKAGQSFPHFQSPEEGETWEARRHAALEDTMQARGRAGQTPIGIDQAFKQLLNVFLQQQQTQGYWGRR